MVTRITLSKVQETDAHRINAQLNGSSARLGAVETSRSKTDLSKTYSPDIVRRIMKQLVDFSTTRHETPFISIGPMPSGVLTDSDLVVYFSPAAML